MKFAQRWRQRQPLRWPLSGLRYASEADGKIEWPLTKLLREHAEITRAYLVRAENRGKSTLVCCIVTWSDNPNANIMQEVIDRLHRRSTLRSPSSLFLSAMRKRPS